MFCRTLIGAIAVLFCTGILVIFHTLLPRTEDCFAQKKLLEKDHFLERNLDRAPAQQLRTGVQKDIWLERPKGPSHIRIVSEKSDLWIQPQNNKFVFTELLESIHCCAQDGQEVQWLTAQKGTFTYPSYHFEASDVTLSIFSTNTFPKMIPDLAPHSSISANFAHWNWPEPLQLQGNVRLFSTELQEKKTFAWADVLIFDPNNNHVKLIAQAPQKVLLWQDEMRLSSPMLEIQRDALKNGEFIKGIGDVHFYFTGEEEVLFHEMFGHKLL